MNHMIHIAAISQIRLDTDGRAYYRRKRAEGKTTPRSDPLPQAPDLRRHLSPARRRRRRPPGATRRGPGRALRGVSRIQRGRLTPAHRHFGSATSRTRTNDATPDRHRPGRPTIDSASSDRLTTEGSRYDAAHPERGPSLSEAACGTSPIAAVGFSRLYSGVDWLTEVLAGRPLAAALTLLFTSLRLLGPAPRDRGSPRTAATATASLDIFRDVGGQPLGSGRS